MKETTKPQAIASGCPIHAITAMPTIMPTFWTEARMAAIRDRPVAISMEPSTAVNTEGGRASDVTRTKLMVSACACASNWPTSTPIQGAASRNTPAATAAPTTVTSTASAAERAGASA